MHRLKSAGLAVATLCLCLNPTISAVVSPAISQTAIVQNQKAEGDRLLEQGNKLRDAQDLQAALESFQKALTMYQEAKDRRGEGYALRGLGNTYLNLKDYEKALSYQQQALAIAQEIKDADLEVRALNNIGLAYKGLGKPELELSLLQQALAIATKTQNSEMELKTLTNLSDAYSRGGQRGKAMEILQETLAKARELKKSDVEVEALTRLGWMYSEAGNLDQGIDLLQQALIIATNTQNTEMELTTLIALAHVHSLKKQPKKATDLIQKALSKARDLKKPIYELVALKILTEIYIREKRYQESVEPTQQWIALARELKDKQSEANALFWLVRAYVESKEYTKAIELTQQWIALARELKDKQSEANALGWLVRAYVESKEYTKAIEPTQQWVALARELKDKQSEANALLMLAVSYLYLGDYQASQAYADLGVTLLEKLDFSYRASYFSSYSLIYFKLRDYEKALNLGNKSLSLARKLKNIEHEVEALGSLTQIYWHLGDYRKAEKFARENLTLSQSIRESPGYKAYALMHLGAVYHAQGKYHQAITTSQQAILTSAHVQRTEGDRTKSLALILISLSYAELGELEKSIETAKSSLSLGDTINQLYITEHGLNLLGDIYNRAGKHLEAINIYRKSLASSVANNLPGGNYAAYRGLGRVYHELKMPLTAITYYKQAVRGIEQVRANLQSLSIELQTSFLQTVQSLSDVKPVSVYRELADLLLVQGRILEAQQVLELLKTQEIQDFTRSNKTEAGAEVPQTPTEEQISSKSNSLIAFGLKVDECEQMTCAQLTQLLNERDGLVQQFDRDLQAIEKEFRDRNIRNTDDASLAPKDFLPQAESIVEAQPGTVLIYPLVMENRTWLLWASRGVVVKRQEVPGVGQKQIGETVLKLRQLLQNPNSDMNELKATSKQLYDWLIKPIESELTANDIRNLVFSLDRATRYIPMAALFDGEKFLLERYTVSTVLSAGYTDMSDRLPFAPQNTNVLALGMSQAKDGFDPLPNVPTELDAIVRQGNNSKTGVYDGQKLLNSAFTFPALRQNLGKQRIVHIATHGKFVPVNPNQSFLLLGDGRLEIPRIRTLQNLRNIDLVVLSACETALGGADQDGVEIAGISSYFLQRGRAKAVMASLWQVNDASTSLLMQQFYKNLANTKQSATKAEALRQAQLRMLRGEITAKDTLKRSREEASVEVRSSGKQPAANFSHPYYWAPFILIGNSL